MTGCCQEHLQTFRKVMWCRNAQRCSPAEQPRPQRARRQVPSRHLTKAISAAPQTQNTNRARASGLPCAASGVGKPSPTYSCCMQLPCDPHMHNRAAHAAWHGRMPLPSPISHPTHACAHQCTDHALLRSSSSPQLHGLVRGAPCSSARTIRMKPIHHCPAHRSPAMAHAALRGDHTRSPPTGKPRIPKGGPRPPRWARGTRA